MDGNGSARTQPVLWARRNLARLPRSIRIAAAIAILLPLLALTNLVYHVIRKPTELFFFVGHRLDKEPAETWRQYGPLFRTYSTSTITPEYWPRWRRSRVRAIRWTVPTGAGDGVLILSRSTSPPPRPSACSRCWMRPPPRPRGIVSGSNAVVDTGCGFTSSTIRAIPSHSTELASVYLDRNVASVLARADNVRASPQQKQDLAAFIHLCGGGPATAFARRNFQMIAGERCGDHLVAAYVSRVNAMKREFARLAADGGN